MSKMTNPEKWCPEVDKESNLIPVDWCGRRSTGWEY